MVNERGTSVVAPSSCLWQQLLEVGLDPSALQLGAAAEEDEDAESYLEALADEEDPWMRSPAPLESALLTDAEVAAVLAGGQRNSLSGVLARAFSTAAAPSSSDSGEALPAVSLEEWRQRQQGRPGQADASITVLIDVRSREEHTAEPLPPAGSLSVPLPALSREAVQGWQTVGVLDSGDHCAAQACVRLRHVFGIRAMLVTGWQ